MDDLLAALRSGASAEESGEAAYARYVESRHLFLSNDQNLCGLLTILFFGRKTAQIDSILGERFPGMSVSTRFVENQDIATCVIVGDGTQQLSLTFGIYTDLHFLSVIMPVWFPTVVILQHNAINHRFSGRLVMTLHDQGYGNGLNFCDNQKFDYLIPDPGFLSGRAYETLKLHYDAQGLPWADRSDRLLWRGSTTGVRTTEDVLSLPRVKLCQMSLMPEHAEDIDARIVLLAQVSHDEGEILRSLGVMGDYVSNGDYAKYKYHVDIDGNTNSWSGLFSKLISGGLVFKVTSPLDFRQWFYDRLKPWEHYVPIQSDLSDLAERFSELRSDPERAIEIAENGRRFANSLSFVEEVAATSEKLDRLATKQW